MLQPTSVLRLGDLQACLVPTVTNVTRTKEPISVPYRAARGTTVMVADMSMPPGEPWISQ